MQKLPTASGILVHCAHDAIVDVTDLKPNPRNPNGHPDKQIALLAKAIKHQGWRHPIVVSRLSGLIVAGHGRVQAAKLLQVEKVPVDYQEFATEEDEWAHLIADNRLAELSEGDAKILSEVLLELDTGAMDMDVTGYDENALEGLMTNHPSVDMSDKIHGKFEVIIECATEKEQAAHYERLTKEGTTCRLLTF